MKAILPYVKLVEKGIDGKTTIQFTNANVQVVNGMGRTASTNGEGNLVVGYDENETGTCVYESYPFFVRRKSECEYAGETFTPEPRAQTGSHDLILGEDQTFISYGGMDAGTLDTISAPFTAVAGGYGDTASATYASVTGGYENTASGEYASVSGGFSNAASGRYASVTSGYGNTASGPSASVSGGEENTASEYATSVTVVPGTSQAAMGRQWPAAIRTPLAATSAWSWVAMAWSRRVHTKSSSESKSVGARPRRRLRCRRHHKRPPTWRCWRRWGSRCPLCVRARAVLHASDACGRAGRGLGRVRPLRRLRRAVRGTSRAYRMRCSTRRHGACRVNRHHTSNTCGCSRERPDLARFACPPCPPATRLRAIHGSASRPLGWDVLPAVLTRVADRFQHSVRVDDSQDGAFWPDHVWL